MHHPLPELEGTQWCSPQYLTCRAILAIRIAMDCTATQHALFISSLCRWGGYRMYVYN
jgi:hypothetical protein